MITSRTRRLSLSIAEQFTALLRNIPLIETVTEPTRLQTGHGLSSKTLENTVSDYTDSHGSCSLAGQISCSVSSRFQKASSLVRNSKKDDMGKNMTNVIDEKKVISEENGKKNYYENNQNHQKLNDSKLSSVKRNIDGVKSTDATETRSPLTATANSALPVRKHSKFIIPRRIPESVLITFKSNNKSKNCNSSDNIVSGKRKSSEIADEKVHTILPKVIISRISLADRDNETKLSYIEQQKEKKRKLDDKKCREKNELTKKSVIAEQRPISKLGSQKETKKTEVNSTEIPAIKLSGKSAAKTVKKNEKEDSEAKIIEEKKSQKSVVKKVKESSNQRSESLKISQAVKNAMNKKEKEKKNDENNGRIQVANEENETKKGKKNSKQAESIQNIADPVPDIPDPQNGGDDSSGDDSLSLGSENGNDDDLFFEE
jgi:hypothetical protein